MFKTLPELFEVVEDLIETEGVDIAEHCRTRQCEPVHVTVRVRGEEGQAVTPAVEGDEVVLDYLPPDNRRDQGDGDLGINLQ
jgi:hypothetical protein